MKERGEIPLGGGMQTRGVVRVGDTVRRPMGPNAPFVHELLRYLEEVGFDGAPRLLGIDERGREVLSFVEGEVYHDLDEYRPSEANLARVAALIRRFHDVTAGSALAGGAEVVAHNELGPHNTVFAGEDPSPLSTGTTRRRAHACSTSPTPYGPSRTSARAEAPSESRRAGYG